MDQKIMKHSIKAYIYLLLCLGFITVAGCSKDEPMGNDPKPVQPSKPDPDTPEEPDIATTIPGEWEQSGTDFVILGDIKSKSQVAFEASDSVTIKWYEEGQTDPYTIAKGKYSVSDTTLKIEWKTVTTDNTLNTAFSTLYLSGECSVADNVMKYSYSVYDNGGGKLSGPHTMNFTKK